MSIGIIFNLNRCDIRFFTRQKVAKFVYDGEPVNSGGWEISPDPFFVLEALFKQFAPLFSRNTSLSLPNL
jgi:hypothetical protein